MPRFVVYGRFDAESIDDALYRLAEHFENVAWGKDWNESPLGVSSIEVRRAEPGEVVVFYA